MAWTAFETAISELLNAHRLGGRFREKLDEAISNAGLPALNWGSGIWQEVGVLNQRRVDYVHRTSVNIDLMPDSSAADSALKTIRDALTDLHAKANAQSPPWLTDDSDRGWMGSAASKSSVYGTGIHAGVNPESPDTLRVVYRDARGEHVHGYHPSSADPEQLARQLLNGLNTPVSYIRVYRGELLELDWSLRMRGAP